MKFFLDVLKKIRFPNYHHLVHQTLLQIVCNEFEPSMVQTSGFGCGLGHPFFNSVLVSVSGDKHRITAKKARKILKNEIKKIG